VSIVSARRVFGSARLNLERNDSSNSNSNKVKQEVPMLVLFRKVDEVICIGHDIEIVVVSHNSAGVRLGIRAPQAVAVDRAEIRDAMKHPRGGPAKGDGEKGGAV
jgi:carbon storage regulator CsrA